ncbi:hypothetical protein LNP17_25670 [Klebsiella variicola subsp. variicola]|nr:hypothetical protein [Klebsiella variicola subsp. variicola]
MAMEIAYDTARSLSDSIQILPSPGETLSYEIKTLSARRFKIKKAVEFNNDLTQAWKEKKYACNKRENHDE